MLPDLIEKMLGGADQSLARLITLVENDSPDVPEIMKLIHPHTGNAYTVGITGPLGVGKSTLVDRLTSLMRNNGLTVGIVAVDPTSPFSGGAVLGDRIRMQQHYLDSGVFIRSMATRGSRGGLPRTARGIVKLLDAFGKDIILVETVGVGQTELDIVATVDTTVVVLVPEAGDAIQTMKAGLTEIADIFVVNKADREGAPYLIAALEAMLHLKPDQSWWQVPVLSCEAINNVGIDALYQKIDQHRRAIESTKRLSERRQQQRKREFLEAIEKKIHDKFLRLVEKDERLTAVLEQVEKGDLDPYSAAAQIIGNMDLPTS